MLRLRISPALVLIVAALAFWNRSAVFNAHAAAAPRQQPTPGPQVIIQSPRGGEALQGVVTIEGTTDVQGFQSVEIAFAYQPDNTNTWFVIQQGSQPVKEGVLASWDTTTITDGDYMLRVQVILQDGQVVESVTDGLRVRNYTVVETSTPEIGALPQSTATPTATPLPDFRVTPRQPEPEPTNPVQIGQQDFQTSVLRGVLAIFSAFVFGAIYLGVRALTRR